MAEDTLRTPRFFCHLCSIEVQGVNPDFTCSVCSSGFIEEIPATQERRNRGPNTSRRNDLGVIRDQIASLLMSRTGVELVNHLQDNSNSDSTRRIPNIARIQSFDRLDNVLLEILNSLAGAGTGAGSETSGNTVFIGNPGDYAWGREGVDRIVTQLLNQMDTSGPPPLAKEEINDIPTVEITDEEVQQKLQCSVCWDNFKLKESVRKLPCSHIYHENCIVPWLRMSGTCPICRKLLSTSSTNTTNSPNVRINSNLDTHSIVRQAFGFDSNIFNTGNPISMHVNLSGLSNASNNSGAASASVNASSSNTNSTTSNSSRTNQESAAANSGSSNVASQTFSFDNSSIEFDLD